MDAGETNLTDHWVLGMESYTTQPDVTAALPLSAEFYSKYAPLLLQQHPPAPPPAPAPPASCNTTAPAGFVGKLVGGYWKPATSLPMEQGGQGNNAVELCAAACMKAFGSGCAAFEVSNACVLGHKNCFGFNGSVDGLPFVRNPQCATYSRTVMKPAGVVAAAVYT